MLKYLLTLISQPDVTSDHKVIFSLRINQMFMAVDKGITWITHVIVSSLPSLLSPGTEAGKKCTD